MSELTGYDISRAWFNFSFANPELVNPNHSALLFFAIEHCNRLGWKQKFGFPTIMAKEAIGIKSYNTYIKTLNDLVDFGFIKMIERSKNQFSANIIALSKNDKALNKALDKAFIKHVTKHELKQDESTGESIDSINKPLTINKEPLTINNILFKKETKYKFRFSESLIDYGFNENLVFEWLIVRKNKKSSNTETAFKNFIKEIEKVKSKPINEILEEIISHSWSGFKAEWLEENKNIHPKSKMQLLNEM